ncbi:hypothetical protein Bca4012_039645 [Brassica carinata]
MWGCLLGNRGGSSPDLASDLYIGGLSSASSVFLLGAVSGLARLKTPVSPWLSGVRLELPPIPSQMDLLRVLRSGGACKEAVLAVSVFLVQVRWFVVALAAPFRIKLDLVSAGVLGLV